MERLIRLVQEYPALYDTCHEDYAKTKVKDEIWSKIAEELDYPKGEAVKEQWRKLRDCHRDALRRQKRKRIGDAPTTSKLWVYQKQMEFLLPYMINRPVSINPAESQVLDGSEDLGESFMSLEDPENQNSSEQIEINEDSIIRKKQKLSENVSNILTETLDHWKRRSLENDELRRRFALEDDDALLQFFMSMYNTTKRMPPASQLRIKKKIFLAVSEEEEELINRTFSETASSIIVTPETSGRSQEPTTHEEYFISRDVKLFHV